MSDDDEKIIDPDLKEELENVKTEDPLLTEYTSGGGGDGHGESIGFAGQWFPDESEWQGKTNITEGQAKALAMARHLPDVFEELEPLRGFLNDTLDDYEMYRTSIEGLAREQQMKILMSIFGGSPDQQSSAGDALASIFADAAGDEEDE